MTENKTSIVFAVRLNEKDQTWLQKKSAETHKSPSFYLQQGISLLRAFEESFSHGAATWISMNQKKESQASIEKAATAATMTQETEKIKTEQAQKRASIEVEKEKALLEIERQRTEEKKSVGQQGVIGGGGLIGGEAVSTLTASLLGSIKK